MLIQTSINGGYHWGNYLIFDRPPKRGDRKEWTRLFDSQFSYYKEPHHYVFAWETGEHRNGEYQEFLKAGFELDSAVVLTTTVLIPPPNLNSQIQIRKIKSDSEWDDVIALQNLCAHPKYLNEYYKEFKLRQMNQYRKMSESELVNWFGAYLDHTLVGDLGIFHQNGVGRYQSVGTHPEFRRRGICGTLVFQTGLLAIKEFTLRHLVMHNLIEKMHSWLETLKNKGIHRGAEKLIEEPGRLLRNKNGTFITDGPYSEAKELVGGFFLIEAKDYGEALKVAQECPALKYSSAIEIREIADTCDGALDRAKG